MADVFWLVICKRIFIVLVRMHRDLCLLCWGGESCFEYGEFEIVMVKLPRAHGGCLGVKRRRRAWKSAKSLGELTNEL